MTRNILTVFVTFYVFLRIIRKKRRTMKKQSRINLTELFLVKADWGRTFMAEISREILEDESEFVRGKVIINEGMAWSTGNCQADLAKKLDDICVMKLDKGLHATDGPHDNVANVKFYHN